MISLPPEITFEKRPLSGGEWSYDCRHLIRARTGEGRERTKARGVKMGRKPKLTAHQQRELIKQRDRGEPVPVITRIFNVSSSTISRLPG